MQPSCRVTKPFRRGAASGGQSEEAHPRRHKVESGAIVAGGHGGAEGLLGCGICGAGAGRVGWVAG